MIISERIFQIMADRGMNQMEFAEATGISQSTISDWKRKKTNPASDKIMKICEVLKVSPYELLQDTMSEDVCETKTDHIVVSEGTDAYEVLLEYKKLDKSGKDRLLGYLKALGGV